MSKTTRLSPSPLTGVGEGGLTLGEMEPTKPIARAGAVLAILVVWLGWPLPGLLGVLSVDSPHPEERVLGRCLGWLACAALLLGWLVWVRVVARGWSAIQDGHARVSAAIVWLLLCVPGIHLAGVYMAGVGLARHVNRFAQRHEIEDLRVNEIAHVALAVAWSLWAVLPFAAAGLHMLRIRVDLGATPFAIAGLCWLAIIPLTVWSANDLCTAINRIADAQSEEPG